MKLTWSHWVIALVLALAVHMQAVQWWAETTATTSQSEQGIEISLSLTARASAPAFVTSSESTPPASSESSVAPSSDTTRPSPPKPVAPKRVKPEPAVKKSAPKRAKPEPAAKKPAPKRVKSEPAAKKPAPKRVKPEPVRKKPAPKRTKSESATKKSTQKIQQRPKQTVKTQPETPPAARSTRASGRPASDKTKPTAGVGAQQRAAAQRDYIARLSAWINRYKRYPRQAQRRRQEGTVKLRFALHKNGQLLSSEIMSSSGYPILDRAALAMLKSAAPLPPIPQELSQQRLEVILPIAFDLR